MDTQGGYSDYTKEIIEKWYQKWNVSHDPIDAWKQAHEILLPNLSIFKQYICAIEVISDTEFKYYFWNIYPDNGSLGWIPIVVYR